MPRKSAEDHNEAVYKDLIIGLLVIGAIVGAVTAAIVGLIVTQLFGNPPSSKTTGVAFVLGATPYWVVRARMRWRFWFNISTTTNRSQVEKQTVGAGGLANITKGIFSRTTIHVAGPQKGAPETDVRVAITRVSWGRQTPPSNPTAVNIYAKFSNRGRRIGLEHGTLHFPGSPVPFEMLYSHETPSGVKGAPILEPGDVKEFMFRFESKAPADLESREGALELKWTEGKPTLIHLRMSRQ